MDINRNDMFVTSNVKRFFVKYISILYVKQIMFLYNKRGYNYIPNTLLNIIL